MKQTVEADIVIFGGGIAGLWLLNRLRQLGFSVILLESNTLGGGQTHKAQGIIHGGLKYALQGVVTTATTAIADMPSLWRQCLRGEGVIDLHQVPVLSTEQYLWSTGSLTSKLAGFFASMALKGDVRTLQPAEFPAIFQHPKFKGAVYALDEMVLDVNLLVRELVKNNQDAIFKIDPMRMDDLAFDANNQLTELSVSSLPLGSVTLKAQKYIFTAGDGNDLIVKKLNSAPIAMQRRPLHMVIMKTNIATPLYAHCLGLGMTPRITVTTHTAQDGQFIWYLGGQLAEEGVLRDTEQQIAAAKQELHALLPWMDFSANQFATFRIDRAEPLQADGKRPDSSYFQCIENSVIAWPTKLALAPKLAEDIIASMTLKTGMKNLQALRAWPIPAIAKPIWDQLLC